MLESVAQGLTATPTGAAQMHADTGRKAWYLGISVPKSTQYGRVESIRHSVMSYPLSFRAALSQRRRRAETLTVESHRLNNAVRHAAAHSPVYSIPEVDAQKLAPQWCQLGRRGRAELRQRTRVRQLHGLSQEVELVG